ncbi:MAG: ABC transporter ATP-binding protein [Candidatus Woesearchaeota archaeon]|nr:MAG: ABC transporter ATP-binding protein [Candidatus Woesearchaeota archaeon]
MIDIEDVWKVYQMGEVEVPALRGLNLKIYPKQLVVIMGPSGSGKSTAMNIIGCLDIPTRGTVKLAGQDISKMHESELAQLRGKKIGFVFQTFNLLQHITALENVILPTIFQNVPKEQREEKAKKILESVGLGDRVNHRPSEMSGGERQRVAIARALVNDPEIVLADEPTGNLDSKTGEKILEVLENLNKEGKTIIIVTHDPDIAKCTNNVFHLKDGKVEGG